MFQTIKKCYDIKSVSLAGYLGLSVDMIHSVLTRRRELGPEQWQAIAILDQALETATAWDQLVYTDKFLEEEKAAATQPRLALIRDLESQLLRKHEKLEQLQKSRSFWLRGLHACVNLMRHPNLSSEQRQWTLIRKKHLELRLREHSAWQEQLLKVDIDGLLAKLEKLQTY